MGISIITPGPLTTIQDSGRTGYMESGFSPSGALDLRSMKIANLLVGNPLDEAVLEVTLMGITAEFDSDAVIAITGAFMEPKIDGSPVPMYETIKVLKGSTLTMGFAIKGCRAYIAFGGGLSVDKVMGSKSLNLKCGIGGGFGRKLMAGDKIEFADSNWDFKKLSAKPDEYNEEILLRVVLGPQDDCFTKKGIRTFLNEPFTTTNQSDRMGSKLDGPFVEYIDKADIISDGIAFGAVQISPSGKPIIMLCDRQTTGGYTKIATVVSVDIPKLVQTKPGCKVRFKAVSVRKAQKLFVKEEKNITKVVK